MTETGDVEVLVRALHLLGDELASSSRQTLAADVFHGAAVSSGDVAGVNVEGRHPALCVGDVDLFCPSCRSQGGRVVRAATSCVRLRTSSLRNT